MSLHPTPEPTYPRLRSDARPGMVLAAVAVVQFLVSLDLSVVNVALPQIADGLGFRGTGVTWVIDAYALTFGGLLLLGGKAADRFGRRRVVLTGLAVFGLACFAGGLAQHAAGLVAARAVQGAGAAALAPAALSILTTTFPRGRTRTRAFGVWSAVNAAGGAFGVLIGGVVTEFLGWRAVMVVNAAMAAIAVALVLRALADDRPAAPAKRIDIAGAVLATGGTSLLVYGIVVSGDRGWASPLTVAALVGAAVLLTAFAVMEKRTTREPLVRLGLLAHRPVASANAFNLIIGAAIASGFYFVSLYLQQGLGTGAAVTGLEILPFGLGVIAGSAVTIRVGHRLQPRALMAGGALLAAAGFAWFGSIDPSGAFLTDVLGPSLVTSLGIGLCLGPVASAATAGVADGEAGTASSLLNSSRQIGAALGLAVLGTAAAARTGAVVTPASLTDGFAFGLALCAALLAVAAAIAVLELPGTGATSIRRAPPPRPRLLRPHVTPYNNGNPVKPAARPQRHALRAMYAGLILSVLAVIVAYADRAGGPTSLAGHLRSGYPAYSPTQIDAAAHTYLVLLTALGGVGVACWLGAIRAVRTGKRWARCACAATWGAATSLAIAGLVVTDTSGDVGLPPLLGWAGLLPCVAGLVAVVLLRRTSVDVGRA
ncbi:MFS transporter [Tomitella gaofuii]|uniref:MFS transporter n=1 Tax=Tomitella gaofuii TaxID=2760083 RepID=UPI001C7105BA|nr:MFS transporter [Tomitella gaofuii]